MRYIYLHCPQQKSVWLIAPEQIVEYGFERGALIARINRFSHIAEYRIDPVAMLAAVNKERGLTATPPLNGLKVENLPLLVSTTEKQGTLVVVGEIGRQGAGLPAGPGNPPTDLPPGFAPQAPRPPQPPAL
jgi:hypothetical protein